MGRRDRSREKRGKEKAMITTLKDKMKALDSRRRVKVERHASQLIAEEMSLQQLRRAHKLTQARLAKSLSIGQDSVARLE